MSATRPCFVPPHTAPSPALQVALPHAILDHISPAIARMSLANLAQGSIERHVPHHQAGWSASKHRPAIAPAPVSGPAIDHASKSLAPESSPTRRQAWRASATALCSCRDWANHRDILPLLQLFLPG